MTIETDFFRRAGVESAEKDEQARRAVKAFRALQPTLTAYARMLTKSRDVRVEMAAQDNGSTDGNRIFYRPPMALGSPVSHQRRVCDKRDDRMQPLCPACVIREEVLVTIYHEIAHICFDSFAVTEDRDRVELVQRALDNVDSKYAERVKARIAAAHPAAKRTYLGLSSLINEFLPIIVNALDDARVNRELFKARLGTKVMFDADTWRVFTKGVEQKDAEGNVVTVEWNKYPLNMQMIVGLFCKASGYDYSNWFAAQVVEALGDEELTNLVRKLDTTRSAAGVYHLSLPILARLRELGFCKTELDPDPEPEPSEESDEEQESEDGQEDQGEPESSDEEGEGEGTGGAGDSSDEASSGREDPQDSRSERSDDGSPADGSDAQEEEPVGEDDGSSSEADDTGSGTGSSDSEPEESDRGAGDTRDEAGSDGSEAGDEYSPEEPVAGEESDPSEEGEEAGLSDGLQVDESDSAEESPEEGDGTESSDRSTEADRDDESEGSDYSDSGSDEHSEADAADQEEGDRPSESEVDSDSTPSSLGGDGADLDSEDEPNGHEDVTDSDAVDTPDSPDSGSNTDPAGEDQYDDERIDTGADDGMGGTEVVENEKFDDLPMGTAEEAKVGLLKWNHHEEKPKTVEESNDEDAVDRAIVQGIYFETPSRNIYGVREHRFDEHAIVSGVDMSISWDHSSFITAGYSRKSLGIDGSFETAESVLGPALLRMRVAFSDNQRGADLRHKKSGKVDARVLGKRAFHNDERLFKKRILPGKKNYFVLIGMDVSGSTVGENIYLEKEAVFAQAELLNRMGIPFAIFAHSGNYHDPKMGRREGLDLDIYFVKEQHEVWDSKVQERLTTLGPDSANLDGHTLEYYRKVLDSVDATDKIILYYTDGKMPAENHDEELEILQREIKICKQKGYTLLGVGIRTDSPVRHGLDTVQVDEHSDVVKVVKHLEKRLLMR